MISKDKSTALSSALKDILENKNTSNRDLELLDTLKNREMSQQNYPDRVLTPQLFFSPDEFKKKHPLFPEYPKFFYPIDYNELNPLKMKDIEVK